jgi:hypothetical protein
MTPEEMYLFHQTPEALAKKLLEFVPLQEGDTVYEPFKGEGAFFKNFPANTTNLWAEIKQNKDYKEEQDYDWVITAPAAESKKKSGAVVVGGSGAVGETTMKPSGKKNKLAKLLAMLDSDSE